MVYTQNGESGQAARFPEGGGITRLHRGHGLDHGHGLDEEFPHLQETAPFVYLHHSEGRQLG